MQCPHFAFNHHLLHLPLLLSSDSVPLLSPTYILTREFRIQNLKQFRRELICRVQDMKFCFRFSSCLSSPSDVIAENTIDGQITENFRVFSHNELKAATNSFCANNKIGEGGFGCVYKGVLKNGTVVAVKVLSVELESMRGEREFISEIAALSNIKHENLVTLKGCCVDGADRFLVYDYMENNSVAHAFLGGEQNRMKFSWRQRRKIAVGVACGLAFLHEEVNPHIVHRDIKAGNILLDHNFTPKVADFGLSKLFTENVSHISTRVAGTLGYLSPEYAVSGRLTRKSDVYSFGVLLLEIVSGRSVMDFDLERGEHYLVDKVLMTDRSMATNNEASRTFLAWESTSVHTIELSWNVFGS